MQTEDHDTDDRLGVTCDDCQQTVTLRRNENDQLSVSCGCDKERFIRVVAVLPNGWQL